MRALDRDAALQRRLLNLLQSALLLSGMAALAGLLGWMLFGPEGVAWAAAVTALALAFTPSVSARWVLRMSGASEIDPRAAPELYGMLSEISARARLPRLPRLFYLPTRVLNAFTAGDRNDAAIALSDGLLRALSPREVAGVLAHEVAHARANDIWVTTLADVVGRLTAILSLAGQIALAVMLPVAIVGNYQIPVAALAVVIFAPLATVALQRALSRTREYDADLQAAALTGDPHGLAAALEKLERLQGGWVERMFMAGGVPKWMQTHPPTRARIRRLLELAPAPKVAGYRPGAPGGLYDAPAVAHRPRWHWTGLWY